MHPEAENSGAVGQIIFARTMGVTSAAIKPQITLYPVAQGSASAMGAARCYQVDCAFETIKIFCLVSYGQRKRFVVVVSAHVSDSHWMFPFESQFNPF